MKTTLTLLILVMAELLPCQGGVSYAKADTASNQLEHAPVEFNLPVEPKQSKRIAGMQCPIH